MAGRSPTRIKVRPPSSKAHGTKAKFQVLDPTKPVHLDWDGPLCSRKGLIQMSVQERLVTCGQCLRILKAWRKELAIE